LSYADVKCRRAGPEMCAAVDAPPVPSRRQLFKTVAGLTAFWGATEAVLAAPPADVSADIDPGSLVSKLVRRITMGATQAELALATSMGYGPYLEYQLNAAAIDDTVFDQALAARNLTTLSLTQQQLYTQVQGLIVNELTEATIFRAVQSKRQLLERMVEFWSDHFNIEILKNPCVFLKTFDDKNAIRPNALGTFPALLSASAHSPAMLTYLDNQESTALAPNENYAREIMELHTLGVDGGYTQTDVYEVARCFSGWGQSRAGATQGEFFFTASRHDNGAKTVFAGTPYQLNIAPGGGINDGTQVINALANHPNTARYIARKLSAWLVREDPSQALVDAVAATYTATGGDIKAMIRTALQPNVLADAPPKYKRPFHLYVSALRALPSTITATATFRSQLDAAGHRTFFWISPDGYPDTLLYWSGLILPRWNFGASLLNNNLNGLVVDYTSFLSGLTTAQQIVDKIDQAMFGGEMSAGDKDRIRTYLLPDPPSITRQRDAIGLAIGSPSFQWY